MSSASVVFGYNITVQSYSDTSVCDPYGLATVDVSEAYACMEMQQSTLSTRALRNYYSSSSSGGVGSGYDTNGVYASHYCAVGSPTGTQGYIYEQFYDAVNCSGHKVYSEGRYADYCFSEEEEGSGSGYYKYQFSDSDCSDLKKLLYEDSNCLRFLSFEYMPSFAQCLNTHSNGSSFVSFQGFCSLGSDVPAPMDGVLER